MELRKLYRWEQNSIGDKLGYPRCPVTGDSLYMGYVNIYLPHNPDYKGFMPVSKNAFQLSLDELASKVYECMAEHYQGVINHFQISPEEIKEEIKGLNPRELLRLETPSYLETYDSHLNRRSRESFREWIGGLRELGLEVLFQPDKGILEIGTIQKREK